MSKIKTNHKVTKEPVDFMRITEKQRETYNHVSSLFHTIVGAANDIAHTYMLDAIDQIKKKGLYRQKVKKACKDAVARYEVFEKLNMQDMQNAETDKRQLYMDFLDDVDQRLKPHIFLFRQGIKRVLDRNFIKDSEFKSYIILAHELINYAVVLFDKFIANCPSCPPVNFGLTFKPARLHPVRQAWEQVEDILCKDCVGIHLDDDDNCRRALDIIETQIISEKFINQSGEAALALNPDARMEADRHMMEWDKKNHKKYELTDRQADYLRENYHLKTNKELASFIGCGLTKLREFAKELGLTKKKVA
nr:MAG TPA: hypothetical protein [Caudoviricetes sp.]